MPFVYDKNNKILKNISLQVQKSIKLYHKKRVSLCSLQCASLTIEAAMVLPLFLLTVVSLAYFLVVLNMQMNLQINIEESAREIAQEEYVLKDIPGNSYVVLQKKLRTEEFSEYINNTFIVNGVNGLSLIQSSFHSSKGICDIVLNYKIKIPFIPDNIITLPFVQRCRFKTWIGEEITKKDTTEQNIVYITKTGTVYHTNRECTHLNLSIRKCLYSELREARNENGGIYHSCSLCDESISLNPGYVYITDSGDKWHTSITCSGLKRDVIEIDIKEVGERGLCQRCKEGK